MLGINEKKMIEIEVKITKSDLLADIKKYKHNHYNETQHGTQWERRWIPTHFYYAVPSDLIEMCKEYLTKHKLDKYGLINSDDFSVHKRAKWLHEREPESRAKFLIALRMGSELIRFHEAWV